MPIKLTCDCGKRLAVRDEAAGKRVKCPACAALLFVPAPGIAPPRPSTERRVLSSGPKEWEKDRSFRQILLEMVYKPGATLEILAAYVGKPSVAIGMIGFYLVSLAAVGAAGAVNPSDPFGGDEAPVAVDPMMSPEAQRATELQRQAQRDSERRSRERERERIDEMRRDWDERVKTRGTFRAVEDEECGAYKVWLSAMPEQIFEGAEFTLTLRIGELVADHKIPSLPQVTFIGPRSDTGKQHSNHVERTEKLEDAGDGTYTWKGSLATPGYYEMGFITPGGRRSGDRLELYDGIEIASREPPPYPDYLKYPEEIEEDAPDEPVPVVVEQVMRTAGPILLFLVGVIVSIIDLAIVVALVEVASRLFSSGSNFLFMAAVLALVTGFANFAQLLLLAVPSLGLGEYYVFFGWLIKLYGVFLYIVAIQKVYGLSGVEAIGTAVLVGVMQIVLSTVIVISLFQIFM